MTEEKSGTLSKLINIFVNDETVNIQKFYVRSSPDATVTPNKYPCCWFYMCGDCVNVVCFDMFMNMTHMIGDNDKRVLRRGKQSRAGGETGKAEWFVVADKVLLNDLLVPCIYKHSLIKEQQQQAGRPVTPSHTQADLQLYVRRNTEKWVKMSSPSSLHSQQYNLQTHAAETY